MTRREFLTASAAASLVTAVGCAEYAGSGGQAGLPEERDLIITGVRAAIDKTLLPALTQRVYPGHFTVTAIRFKVCAMGQKHDWFWSERYHAGPGDTVHAAGNAAYCEYPAILVRVVLGNPRVFPECGV